MSLNLEVCEKCGAYYDTSKWNTYFMESTHENWHREQEYALEQLTALINDETRNIRSDILPGGTIYIEEVKGENN